jgi:transposase
MSTTRRIFPEAFKREAVDRLITSGLSVGKVATKLGLHATMDDAISDAGAGGRRGAP